MNKKRLLKMADHLERGQLGHEKFDFNVFNCKIDKSGFRVGAGSICGTLGCALSEQPIVFPRYFYFAGRHEILLKKNSTNSTWEDAERFYGVDDLAVMHLFAPYGQHPALFGGKVLLNDATRKQVASNIRAFVKRMEPKKKRRWPVYRLSNATLDKLQKDHPKRLLQMVREDMGFKKPQMKADK